MKHVFIINPKAGKGTGVRKILPQIERYAENHPGFDYVVYITKSAGDGQRYAKEIASAGEPVRLYACGGDGTLYEIANGAFGYRNAEIAVVPLGSGNDFIRLFGTQEQFADLQAQIDGTAIELDAIRCGDRIALNQCSMGFDAETCNKQQDFKNLKFLNGDTSYVAALLYCFLFKMENEFTIQIGDEEPFTQKVLFCVAGNSRWYGGGFMAAPFAMPDDGLLDIVVVRKNMSRAKLLSVITPYKQGRLINHPMTIFKRAKKVTITAKEPVTANIDGECIQTQQATFELMEKSVRFVIPTSTDYLKKVASGEISYQIDFEKFKF